MGKRHKYYITKWVLYMSLKKIKIIFKWNYQSLVNHVGHYLVTPNHSITPFLLCVCICLFFFIFLNIYIYIYIYIYPIQCGKITATFNKNLFIFKNQLARRLKQWFHFIIKLVANPWNARETLFLLWIY